MRHDARNLFAALHEPEGRNAALLQGLGEADWSAVADLALRQRVGSLLFAQPELPLPLAVRERLRARAQHAALRILTLQAAFRELATAAAADGLDLIALKGIHLATSIYRRAGTREMADIDLLVPSEQLRAAAALARSLGYVAPTVRGTAHHHLPPMIKGRVTLEIHWQLFDDGQGALCDPSGLSDRAVDLKPFPGAKCLSPEDLLLHVCLHAASHHVLEMGIRSLCDVQAIVSAVGPQLSWDAVMRRAREWRGERSVALILVLAQTHLGVRVPDHVFTGLKDAIPSAEIIESASDLLLEDAAHLAGTSEAARELLTLGSTRERVRHIVDQIVRPFTTRPATAQPQGVLRRGLVGAAAKRAYGLVRRHGGWLWRASRETTSPLRSALARRNQLAAWIRDR